MISSTNTVRSCAAVSLATGGSLSSQPAFYHREQPQGHHIRVILQLACYSYLPQAGKYPLL